MGLPPAAFQLILSSGGHVDHLRGYQYHMLIFFVIFNLTLICHLSGQEALFVGSLTRGPSLIWNTAPGECVVPENIHTPHTDGQWKFLGGGGAKG